MRVAKTRWQTLGSCASAAGTLLLALSLAGNANALYWRPMILPNCTVGVWNGGVEVGCTSAGAPSPGMSSDNAAALPNCRVTAETSSVGVSASCEPYAPSSVPLIDEIGDALLA